MGVVEFSMDHVRPGDRASFWREEVWQAIGRFEVSPGEQGFAARALFRPFGNVRIGAVESSAHRIERSPDDVRGSDRQLFKLVMPQNGQLRIDQGDRRILVDPGEWAIYNMAQAYRFECSDDCRMMAMFVRAEDLRVRDLGAYSMAAKEARRGYSRLLADALDTVIRGDDEECSESDIDAMLLRLTRLALMEHGCAEIRRSSRDIMIERIDAFLETHLRQPDLSIDQIAAALNCSKRYLHKVFLDSGETLSAHVLRRRLEACRMELIDPSSRQQSVTEIAYGWGFSSLPHFSRVFKEAFGMSPREYRLLYGGAIPMHAAPLRGSFRRH